MKIEGRVVKMKGVVVKIEGGGEKRGGCGEKGNVFVTLLQSSSQCSDVAGMEAADVADDVRTWSWRGA